LSVVVSHDFSIPLLRVLTFSAVSSQKTIHKKMIFRNIIVNTLALIISAALPWQTAAASYDYNYEDFRAWNEFAGSSCNGLKNSPVAIKTKDCTRYEDYALTVSTSYKYELRNV
jgi:hypothetical protein